ncbi:hypothetical protein JMJ35_010672 [Cladonia borealis]|uniref:NACHT domain-containing protein n=1 Tax=Cladonia borealis TaxID=184061 RepID=A0AA39QPY5_9LECA|nr:hypothetical protein JMJ35_010672 [Cladonia borealis]
MDPISALSLACNVFQLVEFSIEIAKVCKELYDNGSTNENSRIEKHTADITAANRDLQNALRSNKPTGKPSRIEKVAQDASATADELKIVLNQLKPSKAQGVRKLGFAFKSTVKALITSGRIKKLQQKLEFQDTALRSNILKDLYIKAGQSDLIRKEEFQSLSQGQKDLIVQLLETQQLLSKKVIDSIKSSEAELTARLSAQNDESARQHREKEYDDCRRRLLKALTFPEINERRNMIEGRVDDFGNTYKWILDNTRIKHARSRKSESRSRQNFLNWLKSGTELFWISGKPGSGKSTLMDYIYHNIQPGKTGSDLLRAWAGSHPVVILTFWFFRPASTPLLRTLHGFWRSLCFQILDTDQKLAEIIRDDQDTMAPSTLRSCLLPDGSSAESWTNNDLKEWFWYMIEHSNRRYCLLIDGLDEIEEKREHLLDTVLSISARSDKFKVCCACRPENPFLSKLKQYPNLRLQDFNGDDIKEDCRRRLGGTHAEKFADQIADRAEGVFLWAHLVSENLARAAKYGEIEEDLELRLKECPNEMSELFRYMLLRLDELYAKQPKPYLRLVDFAFSIGRQATLLELLVATLPPECSPKWSEWSGKFEVGFLSDLEKRLDGLGQRIESTCTGLVQCLAPINEPYRQDLKSDYSDPRFPRLDDAVTTPVVFIHRSVHDFLIEDKGGADHYQSFKLADVEAAKLLMAAAACPLFFSNEKSVIDVHFSMMYYAQTVSKEGWDAKASAIMDAFFKQLELRSSPTQKVKSNSYSDLSKRSTDLSLYENLSVGISSMYDLDTYVHIKILEADPARRHAIAAYALCSHLSEMDMSRYRGEIVTTLSPYVDARQVYKFIYKYIEQRQNVDRLSSRGFLGVVSTCSLLVHVVVAMTNGSFAWCDYELDYLRLLLGFLSPYADTEPDESFVEGWIWLSDRHLIRPYVYNFPTPDDDCVFMKERFEGTIVLVFQIRPQDILRADIFPPKVVRWSPAGTKRFLPINEAVQQKFRRSHSRKSWNLLWQDLNAALVESLNSLEDDMTKEKFRKMEALNMWIKGNESRLIRRALGFDDWIRMKTEKEIIGP